MMRAFHAVTVIVILAACIPHSSAQPSSTTPRSQAVLDEAERLDQQAVKLDVEGQYRAAIAPAERALALREKALGPTHPLVAQSLNSLASLYWAQGVYAKTEPLLTRALGIREKALGPTHPEVATSLNNLARLYQVEGAYAKAEPLLTRALEIREKTLGPNHPAVAQSLNDLAELYRAQGAYAKAEPLLTRALDIREKALEPTHPDVATSLNNLAELYRVQGAYAKAEPLLTRALDIREKVLGPTHHDVATSLNELARFYRDQGAYAKAEPLLVRALAIREKALGPSHPEIATSLNDLAELYRTQGAYAKAEPLLVRALAIREKALGRSHPEVAQSLANLAELYSAQGAYAKAEPLYARALTIREKVLGPSHPEVARSLNNLAELYRTQGAYAKAEPLLARALAIREKVLGLSHPEVARSLNNLAELYQGQGAYAKAEPLLVRALAIYEKALGPNHPQVAQSLASLAELYRAQGANGKAEPLFARALAIREKTLGPSHPDVANNLNNLATMSQAQGANSQAESLLAREADIREQQLSNELTRLSEARKRALMTLVQGETYRLVSFHADTAANSATALELAFTTILRRKGRILDSLLDSEITLRAHLTPPLQGLVDQLSQARAKLVAQLYASASAPSATAAQRDAIAALRVHIDELETALSIASEDVGTQAAPVAVATVQAALPADAALVEFVRYDRFDPRQAQQPWQGGRYVAYLLTRQGPRRWVALGDAAPIDAAVDAVLAAMDSRIPVATAKAALQRLDALVFAPIRAKLSGVSHVILAPDGKLNLVPFEALVDGEGHYVLERYLVSYVSSGRDLLRLATPQQPRSAAVIIAAPDYGPRPSSPSKSRLWFAPLAGADAEAQDLRGYFPTAPVTGAKATKAALATLTGPAILHIVTQGFYGWPAGLAGPAGSSAGATVSRGPSHASVGTGSAPAPTPDPAEGMDQSGLAMAGANRGPEGILTARELAGFDWWGTQLVVLSASQSGVGAVSPGDGVYGLRRALVLAGTASQVVSLWNIADAPTRALMRDFYAELKQGTGRAEALRRAELRLLQQPGYAHPFYWAAFIPAGDWRPLDATAFLPQKSTP